MNGKENGFPRNRSDAREARSRSRDRPYRRAPRDICVWQPPRTLDQRLFEVLPAEIQRAAFYSGVFRVDQFTLGPGLLGWYIASVSTAIKIERVRIRLGYVCEPFPKLTPFYVGFLLSLPVPAAEEPVELGEPEENEFPESQEFETASLHVSAVELDQYL